MRTTCKVLVMLLLVTCGMLGMASDHVFTNLVAFDGTNGEQPWVLSLAQDFDGSLNGTTAYGGSANSGVTFKLSRRNRLSTINNLDRSVGTSPRAGVILAADGSFYGTTTTGGQFNWGTVFRVTRDGSLSVVHQFSGSDGSPTSLIQGIGGRFYGTTRDDRDDSGSVFEMSPDGKFRTLHAFNNTEGCRLVQALTQDVNGDLYGTAGLCGREDGSGYGTVFKLALDGTLTTLHVFNVDDGSLPQALVRGTDGNFYGTTFGGGTYANGTVFRITSDGSFTTLYSFCGMPCGDGENPDPLIQATDGNLYGGLKTGAGVGELYSSCQWTGHSQPCTASAIPMMGLPPSG